MTNPMIIRILLKNTDAIPDDSEWEVSDFLSSSDSSDDWVPRI